MPKIIYEKIPEFSQFVEFVTQSDPIIVDGDVVCGANINRVPVGRFFEGDESDNFQEVLDTVSKDYEKVSSLRPIEGMDEAEIEEVKTNLGKRYHSDVVEYVTQDLNPVSVVNTAKEVSTFPDWKVNIFVEVGSVYMYEDNLYEVVQAHTTQADWTPPIAKSLWKRYYEPSDDPWPWVQPTGAHDAYPLGARVLYNGNIYESTIDANVWAPDVTGWKNLTAPVSDAWAAGVAYSVGDEVTYNNKRYRCLQSHTSQVGWEPSKTPALWELV